MALDAEIVKALGRGVDALCRAQHAPGNWTDFWLSIGTSDEWITAWTGLALEAVGEANALSAETEQRRRTALSAARQWLAAREHAGGGWGYNRAAAVDADSTAMAISLLCRGGAGPSKNALAALLRHQIPGAGYRTYAFRDASHAWTRPALDITASALRALTDAGQLDREHLRAAFNALLHGGQGADGCWHGYWWPDAAYTTALVLEVWRAAGGGALLREVPKLDGTGTFAACCELSANVDLERDEACVSALQHVLDAQQADGSWPGGAVLRVPPSHPYAGLDARVRYSRDARGVFTTAAAVRAVARALRGGRIAAGPRRRCTVERRLVARVEEREEPARARCERVVSTAAIHGGLPEATTARVVEVFRKLTRHSLAAGVVWPAPQLSSLSGGAPLELSVVESDNARPALRYTVELGDVKGSPHRRALTALDALADAAARLGYVDGWNRVLPTLRKLIEPSTTTEEWHRFLVWAGVDHELAEPTGALASTLKVYVHTFSGEGPSELEEALALAGLPLSRATAQSLAALAGVGHMQEIGLGITRDQIGSKVYFELDGWRRPFVDSLLERLGFCGDADALCPAVPGLLEESLARHSRSGIALRLDPESGEVVELTSAIAFIQGMLEPGVIAARLQAWLHMQGFAGAAHAALYASLASLGASGGPHHTLLTRTLTRTGTRRAAVYLRP